MFSKIRKIITVILKKLMAFNSSRSNRVALELKKKGDAYLDEDNYDQALEYYRQASKVSPKLPEVLVALGFVLNEKGYSDEAIHHLQHALSVTPDNADAHFILGNISRKKGDSQQAIDHYLHATNSNPKFDFAYSALFEMYQTLGESTDAKNILDRAISALPSSTSFIFERAGLYFAEKDYQNTIIFLKKALLLSPDNVDCHVNIATTYIHSGQPEAAIPHFQKASKLKPNDAAIQQDMGNAYLVLGKKLDALACFKEVIRIEPDSPLKHLVAAFSGQTTNTAPAGYVENLFDHYAENFDSHLTQTLQYKTPSRLASLIQAHLDIEYQKLDILDLGCGTGQFGQAITPFAKQLVGVDLSLKMLEKSALLNIYHRLEHKELLEMMHGESENSYDLIAASDVFVYLGMLDDIVAEAKRLLRPNGIFTFSVESLEALPKSLAESKDFVLNDTGRYAHSMAYLNMLAKDSGFSMLEVKEESIRLEGQKAIIGYLALWRLVDNDGLTNQ